jgi:hypothetical protein
MQEHPPANLHALHAEPRLVLPVSGRDLKTPLPKKMTLKDPAKIFEIAERGGYKLTLENRQSIENAIVSGRGSIWLDLTQEQYQKLRKK